MSEVLRNATWCHPLCAQDHVDIVSAFEAGDRDAARALIVAHAGRSKQTMRRAMADTAGARRPIHHAGPLRRQGRRGHRARPRASASRPRAGSTPKAAPLCSPTASELVKELADELTVQGTKALAVTADLEH